jgi:hypothetical protein
MEGLIPRLIERAPLSGLLDIFGQIVSINRSGPERGNYKYSDPAKAIHQSASIF